MLGRVEAHDFVRTLFKMGAFRLIGSRARRLVEVGYRRLIGRRLIGGRRRLEGGRPARARAAAAAWLDLMLPSRAFSSSSRLNSGSAGAAATSRCRNSSAATSIGDVGSLRGTKGGIENSKLGEAAGSTLSATRALRPPAPDRRRFQARMPEIVGCEIDIVEGEFVGRAGRELSAGSAPGSSAAARRRGEARPRRS